MRRRLAPPADSTRELLLTLGGLVGQTREGLKVQRARVELAMALQRHMLPPRLVQPPGLRIAARYAPSRDGLDVGGDWYDAFAMAGGAVGISIGDVQGHDMEAIALMGQVRTALRAIAGATTDPGEVLGRTNDLLLSMSSGLFVTCCFLRFDPVSGDLAVSRAGHVPMVWTTTDGRSGVALDSGGPPLGIVPGQRYAVSRRRLTGEGTFILLTDGVVEGPSYPIDEGLAEVLRLASTCADAAPDDLAAQVIKVADLTGHSDDAAVLVIRFGGVADPG